MKKLQILMSTYNGKKFIREQLDSILAQDCETLGEAEFKLLIRDDGSTDGTQEVLSEYSDKYSDKISWYQGDNVGVISSFFDLMQNADDGSDYFALSDQDDYWLTGKMSAGVKKLKEISDELNISSDIRSVDASDSISDNSRPLLYCCRPTLTDEKLNRLSSNIDNPKIRPGFGNALIENIVTGCTSVFNNKLRQMIAKRLPEFTTMHDRWMYLTASCFGNVYYDEESYIYYRQHGGNAVGRNTNRFSELKYRLNKFKKDYNSSSRQAEEFMRIFSKELKLKNGVYEDSLLKEIAERKRLLTVFLAAKHSMELRNRLVKSGRIYRQRSMDNKIFNILIRLNIY